MSTSARCALDTRALATATVMPRPMAAGVFGMARMSAAPGSAASRKRKVRPAMIDTATVAAPTNRSEHRHDLGRDLRLDRDHHGRDLADRVVGRIEADAALRQRGQVAGRRRFDDDEMLGRQAERQPAFQQRASHLAGAGQEDGFGQMGEGGRALRARNRCCHGRALVITRERDDAVSAALAIGKWCGAAGYRPARRSRENPGRYA